MNIDVQSDRALIHAQGSSSRYVLVSFIAPSASHKTERVPVNIAFVLDRSGSMEGEGKIELAKEAAVKAIGMLSPQDRFAVVVYDEKIDVVMESTLASKEAKSAALRQLRTIEARGSTDLGGGWLSGCEQAAMNLNGSATAKCLLLTDGLANCGIVDPAELAGHAAALRERGVLTSTFGVGGDFDERLLQAMADAGGGHSYYIEKAIQIPDYLTSELGETLEVVAHGAALQFVLPDGVNAEPLSRFPFKHSGDSLSIDLGSLVSEQEVSVVVRFQFPEGQVGDTLSAGVCLTDDDGVLNSGPVEMAWRFADDKENEAQPRNHQVDKAVAELYAAKAREEAVEHNRMGRYDLARAAMARTAERIHQYAGSHSDLKKIASGLRQESALFQTPLCASEMKAQYFQSQHTLRHRDSTGKSRRRS